MTRERDRYTRMTLRDQLEGLLDWIRGHRLLVIALLVAAIYVVTQLILPPPTVRPNDLRVGDCLFVRTASMSDLGSDAPIGDPALVGVSLLSGGADRAPCGASHGHEVSAVLELPAAPAAGQQAGLERDCAAAFEPYVGRALIASSYETFAVVPTAAQWDAGIHRAICLIARVDGQWMTHPARASGE
ncbi:MAG: hypothetical protein EPO36_02395 [Chloroflexota bacterium]|nr:MAG: hypothetical protein EPO36_02395 [Chloroflexota bacterium]